MTEQLLPPQATHARAALNHYARIVADDPVILNPEHPKDCAVNERIISGFLADLRHLCDVLGLDYSRVQAIANLHYEQEKYEGGSI